MTATDLPLEERVAALEQGQVDLRDVTQRLKSSTETLKRGQRETRAQVRRLTEIVEGLPATIHVQLGEQTMEIKTEVAQSEARTATLVAHVARQTTAPALVALTAAAGSIAVLVLHALDVVRFHW